VRVGSTISKLLVVEVVVEVLLRLVVGNLLVDTVDVVVTVVADSE